MCDELRVARNAYDTAHVVLEICVVQQRCGAVFRVVGSQPGRLLEAKPATDKPATDKPATDKPATDKPATEKVPGSNPGLGITWSLQRETCCRLALRCLCAHGVGICGVPRHATTDTLAEWLRRRPAKPMGSPRVGSNPTGVVSLSENSGGYQDR